MCHLVHILLQIHCLIYPSNSRWKLTGVMYWAKCHMQMPCLGHGTVRVAHSHWWNTRIIVIPEYIIRLIHLLVDSKYRDISENDADKPQTARFFFFCVFKTGRLKSIKSNGVGCITFVFCTKAMLLRETRFYCSATMGLKSKIQRSFSVALSTTQ